MAPTAGHADDSRDWTVGATDDSDHRTIQEAVNAANPGDTIEVAPGTYRESVTLDKSLTLRGPTDQSPNSADPLMPAVRDLEAVIKPAAGAALHGIIFGPAATDATVTGFTVDLTDGVENQDFISAGTAEDRNLTLTNNLFVGGARAAEGSLTVSGALGNASITFVDNRVEDRGQSNGLHVHNSSEGTFTTLKISNNVWRDNLGLAMNMSGTSTRTGTISNNWIGNSTPGESEVDNFGKRQGGMVLAGKFDKLEISNNMLSQTEDAAISFWSGFSGSVTITDNHIDGYSNVENYAAVYVRPSGVDGVSNVSEVTFTNNSFTNPTSGSRAVLNQSDTGTFNAALNWWGSATPDFESLVKGENVTTLPFYANAELTEIAPKETSVTLSGPQAIVQGSDSSISATVAPADAVGTIEILAGSTPLASSDTGSVEAGLAGLAEGSHTLKATFTPEEDLAFEASTSEDFALQVNVKNATPPPPPADSSEALDELIEREGLDVPGTTEKFEMPADGPNNDLGNLDPSEPLIGELEWPNATDSFVDVYAYSTPVHLGTFPVVDGKVILSADISGLASGTHRLLFVGQTSGEMQAMEITVQGASTPVQPGTTTTGGLAQTGADSSFAPIGLGALAILLGLGLAATGVMAARRRKVTE